MITVGAEQLIAQIQEKIHTRDYVWFRFTWSKVGGKEPEWIVWLEKLTGTEFTTHNKDLTAALKEMLWYLQCLENE